jgi:hypothetical protein
LIDCAPEIYLEDRTMTKPGPAAFALFFLAVLLPAGCRTPNIRRAAPRGATSILKQLEALGEERTIALEGDIRGSAHPCCSLLEAFLKAKKNRAPSKIRLVERNLLGLIKNEYAFSGTDVFDEGTLVRLGELLRADTVVIGWGGEKEKKSFAGDPGRGTPTVKDSYWYTTYLHMVAIDIPSGSVIASWSFFPGSASGICSRISPWIRRNDVVVVQQTLDDQIKGALLAGLHRGSRRRYRMVVRDLVHLLTREAEVQSSDFFSHSNQDRLRISGATVIVGADSAMGMNLRAIDVRSGEIIGGLPGPFSDHITTAYESPRIFSL